MSLINIIREHFATLHYHGTREILVDGIRAWSIIEDDRFGVLIENPNGCEIVENFANVKIYNTEKKLVNELIPVIMLSSDIEATRREFAVVCAQFVELGENNENRDLLTTDPFAWVEKWKSLLGNTIKKKLVYDVIAEMLAIEALHIQDVKTYWSGPDMATRDIETKELLIDVKSTTTRYNTNVTISSQYQLEADKKLLIYFCRLEKAKTGESINSVAKRLSDLGYDMTDVESKLYSMGYERSRPERDATFNVLERSIFKVDESFPQITPSSFVEGKLPDFVIKIEYTVNLDSLQKENW